MPGAESECDETTDSESAGASRGVNVAAIAQFTSSLRQPAELVVCLDRLEHWSGAKSIQFTEPDGAMLGIKNLVVVRDRNQEEVLSLHSMIMKRRSTLTLFSCSSYGYGDEKN